MSDDQESKKFSVEIRPKPSERTDDKEQAENITEPSAIPEDSLVPEIIGQALVDEPFREKLFSDKESVLSKYQLSDSDKSLLDKLTLEDLTKHIEGLGGATAWKIYVEINKSF